MTLVFEGSYIRRHSNLTAVWDYHHSWSKLELKFKLSASFEKNHIEHIMRLLRSRLYQQRLISSSICNHALLTNAQSSLHN